jgi:hypothetical protein
MRIDEILHESRAIVLEYGRKGFPGYGMGLFGQRYYEYMVPRINEITDTHAKEWLVHWLCDVFRRDNPKFSVERFMKAILAHKNYNASPVFQQRHFYYLARWVQEIDDPHIHDFVQDWLGNHAGRTNPQFKPSVWAQYCAREIKPPPHAAAHAARPDAGRPDVEPVDEGPAYGSRGHGGFGRKIFTRAHSRFIAWKLSHLDDAAVRGHLITWWSDLFKLDDPGFKPEAFVEAASGDTTYYHRPPPDPRWQQRHFYFIAREIAEIVDPHERKFVCDWFAEHVGSTNGYFQVDRWEKYCHLEPASYERKAVQHDRAKATGAAEVPVHPSVAAHAAWLAKHPNYARDNDLPEDDAAA